MVSLINDQLTKTTSTLQSKPDIIIANDNFIFQQGKEAQSKEDLQNELPLRSDGCTGGNNHMVLLLCCSNVFPSNSLNFNQVKKKLKKPQKKSNGCSGIGLEIKVLINLK
jgi:hypothetical protein